MRSRSEQTTNGAGSAVVSDALAWAISSMLDGPDVQTIGFQLGHVRVTPDRFRRVAAALRLGGVRIVVDPMLLGDGSQASYVWEDNTIIVPSTLILRTASTRALVLHECVHAGTDWAGRQVAVLHEEGSAVLTEAWYLINQGHGSHSLSPAVPQEAFDIVSEMRSRAPADGSLVRASSDQINAARHIVRRLGYPLALYRPDGWLNDAGHARSNAQRERPPVR